MKYIWILVLFLLSIQINAQYQLNKEWEKIELSFGEGKVKSTIPLLKNYEKNALLQHQYSEHYNAFMLRLEIEKEVALEENLDEIDNPTEILELKKLADNQSGVYQSVLRYAYINMLMQYFDESTYEIEDRTEIEQKPAQITEWTTQHFKQEIESEFQKLFQAKEILYKEEAKNWKKIYKLGTNEVSHLSVFQSIIQSYKSFSNVYDFRFTDEEELKQKETIIKLSEDLNQYYKNANYIDAYLFSSEVLLRYKDVAGEAYQKALEKLIANYSSDYTANLLFLLAETYTKLDEQKNDYILAKAIAEKTIQTYPKSQWISNSKTLIETIEIKDAELKIPQKSLANELIPIVVAHKNLNKIYVRIYNITANPAKYVTYEIADENKSQFTYNSPLVRTDVIDLQSFSDYKTHSTWYKLQALPTGKYNVVLSNNENFIENQKDKFVKKNYIEIQENVIFSKINTQNNINKDFEIQIVNAKTGKPLSQKKASLYELKEKKYNLLQDFQTNDVGQYIYLIPNDNNSYYWNFISNKYIYIEETKEFVSLSNITDHQYVYEPNNEWQEIATLFTDRAIYRPSQTVYCKVIAYKNLKSESKLLGNETFTLELHNANDEVVSKTENLVSNELGSFHTNFVLPTSGLTGDFSIYVFHNNKIIGNESIKVEEYKRPKFEVAFQPIKEEFTLNSDAKVTGNAISFAGANITEAKVTYRITRQEIFPFPAWNGYRCYFPYRYSSEEHLTNGETTTNDKGEFIINFKTEIPETTLTNEKEKSPITYTYKIYADVTDINGETHSADTSLSAGIIPKKLAVEIEESYTDKDLDKKQFTILSTNLNEQKVPAKGTYTITKLIAPNRIITPTNYDVDTDYNLISEENFETLFPNLNYKKEEQNRELWKKGTVIITQNFTNDKYTEKNNNWGKIHFPALSQGNYIIEVQELHGNDTIRTFKYFKVYNNQTYKVENNDYFTYRLDKPTYKVGETAKVIFSTDTQAELMYYAIEENDKVSAKKILQFTNGQAVVEIPITPENKNGIFVQFLFVQYKDGVDGNITIPIVQDIPTLEITTEVFRDKVQTGKPETWKLKITGKDKEKVTAELLATMYDKSLDEFTSHTYYFNPLSYRSYSIWDAFNTYAIRTYLQQLYLHRSRNYSNNYSWASIGDFITDYSEIYSDFSYKAYETFALKQKTIKKSGKSTASYSTPKIVHTENPPPPPPPPPAMNAPLYDSDGRIDKDEDVKSLSGAVSGIQFLKGNEQPEPATEIKIRGIASELGNGKPFIIVDGVPYNGDLSSLNEADIENATVLKDAAATSLYGSRAANGAIIITTKAAAKKGFEQVTIRKNLQETAFFYPQLKTDDEGNIIIEFTTPEALTQWKVLLLAHTKELAVGIKTLEVKTQKELMVVPNVPRFLRENDKVVLATKITNLSEKALNGNATIQFFDAFTMKNIDEKFQRAQSLKPFTLAQGVSTALQWEISVPEGVGAVVYRVIAKTPTFSDGEENVLPILTNRMLVTETMPISVREGQTKTYQFAKLKNNTSTTLRNHSLTLELNTNPVWMAVSSLPYLREYPHECSEQLFSRLYGNILSSYIINSQPKIKKVFDIWNAKEVNKSKLELNQELKSILIEETPWLRNTQDESQQMKQLAVFFDLNTMANELKQAKQKLIARQSANGAFVWFEGGNPDLFITQHIVAGIGKLKKLTGKNYNDYIQNNEEEMVEKAIHYTDSEILVSYNKEQKKKYPSYTHYEFIQYAYARSFWLEEFPLKAAQKSMINKIITESIKYKNWDNLQSKAQLAIILKRFGYTQDAEKLILQLKETSVESPENGVYWKENISGWRWYDTPVETQSMLVEAFDEVTPQDQTTIEGMKVWLIKNKQNNRWESTKATTEAVYALLHTGKSWVDAEKGVSIQSTNFEIPNDELAQSGQIKAQLLGDNIQVENASVTISKNSAGIALGGMYWQYFENLDKITHAKGGIYMEKELFLKKNTSEGVQLIAITENKPIKVGDLVTVRLVIKIDRDMEYIHIKDGRASGFEPVNVLSAYKWNNSFGYYESTRDAATNFFISSLPKGSYVFEYDLRANNAGNFSNGITTLQNMYAPEMSAHSQGISVEIK